jgi:hypothetical protein
MQMGTVDLHPVSRQNNFRLIRPAIDIPFGLKIFYISHFFLLIQVQNWRTCSAIVDLYVLWYTRLIDTEFHYQEKFQITLSLGPLSSIFYLFFRYHQLSHSIYNCWLSCKDFTLSIIPAFGIPSLTKNPLLDSELSLPLKLFRISRKNKNCQEP